MRSIWTKKEIRYAYETNKKVVPVNIDGCTPRGWFLFHFAGTDIIDFSSHDQREKMIKDLDAWCKAMSPGPLPPPQPSGKLTELFNVSIIIQVLFFGAILVVMSSMFFFGLLTMKAGFEARFFNLTLCVCLLGTICCLYMLYKKKKIAFPIICILDIVEILLLCVVSEKVADYAIYHKYRFHLFPYISLENLGRFIRNIGFLAGVFLMEFLAFFHIVIMIVILFIKIKGHNIWEEMKSI